MSETSEIRFPIDAVYLWVDGNDPAWRQKRQTCLDKLRAEGKEVPAVSLAEGRYSDNGELRYSLRSLAKFAPWVNRVHIVTDNQRPDWLKTEAVHLVDHTEILPPEAACPVFSNRPLEFCVHRIPGLAEHYLDFNDDFMLGRTAKPQDFFTADGRPRIWAYRENPRKLKALLRQPAEGLNPHKNSVRKAHALVLEKTGKFISRKLKHYPRAVTRSSLEALWKAVSDEIAATLRSPFRSKEDMSLYPLYSLYLAATDQGELRELGGLSSVFDYLRLRPVFTGASLGDANFKAKAARIRRLKPLAFCLNDAEHAIEEDRQALRDFLEEMFPQKSPFEK